MKTSLGPVEAIVRSFDDSPSFSKFICARYHFINLEKPGEVQEHISEACRSDCEVVR